MTTSRAGYWIGGAMMAAAAIGAVLWVVFSLQSLTHKVDAFQRIDAGESQTLTLQARKYVIYAEGPNADRFTPYVDATVTDTQSGQQLPTSSYITSLTYSFGGHSGDAVETVTPPHAGRYEVSFDGQRNSLGSSSFADVSNIALGESIGSGIVRSVLGAVVIAALLGLSGIAVLTTTIVRRYNARKRAGPPPPLVGSPPVAYAPVPGAPPGYAPPESGPPPPPAPETWRGS